MNFILRSRNVHIVATQIINTFLFLHRRLPNLSFFVFFSIILQEEVNKNTSNVTFTKVNTEKYPKIASQYSVQALPTLVLFKNGKPISRIEGVLNASDLKRWIEQGIRTAKAV